jgi:hypothetical protein
MIFEGFNLDYLTLQLSFTNFRMLSKYDESQSAQVVLSGNAK